MLVVETPQTCHFFKPHEKTGLLFSVIHDEEVGCHKYGP